MNKEELAEKLNGTEYPLERHFNIDGIRHDGLVIVSGGSDDICGFSGAIVDEFGCYDGGECLIDKDGLLPEWESVVDDGQYEYVKKYFAREKSAKRIEAQWDNEGYSWTYKTDIPHATFDIMDEGKNYCRGIVFSIDDLGSES